MNSQLYTATSGLVNEQRRLELISNNLANASTAGYRAQRMFSTLYREEVAGAPDTLRAANAAVAPAGTYSVPGSGPIQPTGRDLDVALTDGDLLAVRTNAGTRYTRAGNLSVSPAGELVDGLGHPLLGPNDQPIGGLGAAATILSDGRVLMDGVESGQLVIFRDPEGLLLREGDGLLSAAGSDSALKKITEPEMMPGWLEGSGTNPLTELVNLIEAQRAFESYQKLISLTMNEVNRRAVNDLVG